MKELIEFLEKKGFAEEASSLRNGGASLKLSEKNIGYEEVKEITELLATNPLLFLLPLLRLVYFIFLLINPFTFR